MTFHFHRVAQLKITILKKFKNFATVPNKMHKSTNIASKPRFFQSIFASNYSLEQRIPENEGSLALSFSFGEGRAKQNKFKTSS